MCGEPHGQPWRLRAAGRPGSSDGLRPVMERAGARYRCPSVLSCAGVKVSMLSPVAGVSFSRDAWTFVTPGLAPAPDTQAAGFLLSVCVWVLASALINRTHLPAPCCCWLLISVSGCFRPGRWRGCFFLLKITLKIRNLITSQFKVLFSKASE